MRFQAIIKYASKFLEPTRVFIALMLAVGMWLFPFISFKEKTITPIEHGVIVSADPFTAGAIGECADVHCEPGFCCVKGYCKTGQDNCGSDDPPPSPPTISANLNCSNWGDNGWCKGSLSIDLSAADPQGQAVVISGAVNGNNFACPSGATSCSIPLSGEGTGSVNYQVNSATGLSATGSTIYKIDLTSPDLDTSVSGAAGTNGWYRSDVTLGVSASDATSGIASITASINGGGAAAVGGSLTFSDGEYSVLIVARDNAGHVTQDTQIIKVDTITPSLSFTTGGTNGKNGWYVSSASAAATASDAGSGLASIEASVDGGTWVVSDSISLGDGVHTYQFRATDVAGNKTETPTQTAMIDTIAPSISMSQGTSLGDKVLYEIEDYGSGLSIFRAVIEDDDEAYQKVTWSGDISGSYIADDILWDGKFADGARAGIGEYMVTLKITDAAGNKAIKTTFVTVGLLDLLDDIPAFAPPISSTSEEDEIPTTASITGPQTFGGIPTTTNAGEFISTTSTVSGITIPTTNIPIDPNILWGAAATAMVGATLADWQRQREEEERARREREATSNAGRYAAIAKAYNASRKNFTAYLNKAKEMGMSDAEVAKLKKNVNDTGKIGASLDSTKNYIAQKQDEAKAAADRARAADAARWAGAAAVAQAKEAAQQAAAQAALDHRMSEHDTTPIVQINESSKLATSTQPAPHISWLSNIPFVGTQLNTAWRNSGIKQVWEEKIVEPIIKPIVNSITPAKVATTLLTVALGANGIQWANSIANNPHIFDNAFESTKSEVEKFYETHPRTEENTSPLYLVTNPFEFFSLGFDATKTLANSLAGYADAAWQANPLVQDLSSWLENAGDQCPTGAGEAWSRRCSAVSYFLADVIKHPADTMVGVGTALIAEPVAGLIKVAAYGYENNNPYQLIKDVVQNGLSETIQDRISDIGSLISDPSVQAFGILALFTVATLLGLGIPALIGGGSLVLGQSASLLTQIDAALQAAPTRAEAMNVVTNPQIRRQLVTNAVLLAMIIYGGARTMKEISRVNAFQQTISPSAQEAFSNLSLIKQIELLNSADSMGTSLGALDFYLTESTRPGSPLTQLSLSEGLQVSSLAERSGKGAFILDYLSKYGLDITLKNTSFEILSQYVDIVKAPNSTLRQITPQEGIKVLSGQVVKIDPVVAVELAAEMAKITGKNAWASPFTGEVYVSASSARAIAAKNQLIAEGGLNSPNKSALLQIIGEESVRGSGDKLQLGPFIVKDPATGLPMEVAGVEKGVYIQDSLNNGTKFFDVGEVYNKLKAAGFTDNQLWPINQEAIRITMESKNPINYVFTDVDIMLKINKDIPSDKVVIRVREMRWIIEHAAEYGYVKNGNGWIWQP